MNYKVEEQQPKFHTPGIFFYNIKLGKFCALVFYYYLKKTPAESQRIFVEAYGQHALGKTGFQVV